MNLKALGNGRSSLPCWFRTNNRLKAMPRRNSGSRSRGLKATIFVSQVAEGGSVAEQSLKPGTGANQQMRGGAKESSQKPARLMTVCLPFSLQMNGPTSGKSK